MPVKLESFRTCHDHITDLADITTTSERWVADLHEVANVLAVGENLRQVLSAEHVAQRRLCEKAS